MLNIQQGMSKAQVQSPALGHSGFLVGHWIFAMDRPVGSGRKKTGLP